MNHADGWDNSEMPDRVIVVECSKFLLITSKSANTLDKCSIQTLSLARCAKTPAGGGGRGGTSGAFGESGGGAASTSSSFDCSAVSSIFLDSFDLSVFFASAAFFASKALLLSTISVILISTMRDTATDRKHLHCMFADTSAAQACNKCTFKINHANKVLAVAK